MKTFSFGKGAIAAGHNETAQAGLEILRAGGNAFDAAVAAMLTSCVVESALTSLGGGGFLNTWIPGQKSPSRLYDFFVQTPGQHSPEKDLEFSPVKIDFGDADQEFYTGKGSMGIPGIAAGVAAIHRDLCTMPMQELVYYAANTARSHELSNFQASCWKKLGEILTGKPEARSTYCDKHGELVKAGDKVQIPHLSDFLSLIAHEGVREFYEGEIASSIAMDCADGSGHIRLEDMNSYQVKVRPTLSVPYREFNVRTNPGPSAGGSLMGFALEAISRMEGPGNVPEHGSREWLILMTAIQSITNNARSRQFNKIIHDNDEVIKFLSPENISDWVGKTRKLANRWGSTTHISILDSKGNAASVTTSVGQGSGYVIPGTGVMMNNMLGESDLNPEGFHRWHPDIRISSMMSPSIVTRNGAVHLVFGSGGANRIRTAMLQVLSNLLDHQMDLEESITAPRIHLEGDQLDLEGGFDAGLLTQSSLPGIKINHWSDLNMYFGGVHGILRTDRGIMAFADPRRDGISIII